MVVDETERLARVRHAVVLPLELELVLFAVLGLVELPCAVDGPVAESAVTGGVDQYDAAAVFDIVKCSLTERNVEVEV